MGDRYTMIVDEIDGGYEVYDNGEPWWEVTDRESGKDLCRRLNKLEAENAKLKTERTLLIDSNQTHIEELARVKAENTKMREALEAIMEEAEDGGSKELRTIFRMAKFVLEGEA